MARPYRPTKFLSTTLRSNLLDSLQQSTSILRQQTFNTGPPQPQPESNVSISTLVKSVQNDMQNAEKGGQWLFSIYAPFKDKPAFPGFEDQSFEEVRLAYYEAKQNGTTEQFNQQIQAAKQQIVARIKSLQNPNQEATKLLTEIYNTPPGTVKEFQLSPTLFSSNQGNFGSTSTFGGSSGFNQNSQSIFGNNSSQGQTQNTFGQGASTFGQSSSTFGQNTSTFGQNTTTFGQNTSTFGQSGSLCGQSSVAQTGTIFGQPTQSGSIFGQQPAYGTSTTQSGNQTGSIFSTSGFSGQSQNQGSIFGGGSTTTGFGGSPFRQETTSGFGQTPGSTNVFGQTSNALGQSSSLGQSSLAQSSSLGQSSSIGLSSSIGQSSLGQSPTVANQTSGSIFTQTSAPSPFGQTTNSPFGGTSPFASPAANSTSGPIFASQPSPFGGQSGFGNSGNIFASTTQQPGDSIFSGNQVTVQNQNTTGSIFGAMPQQTNLGQQSATSVQNSGNSLQNSESQKSISIFGKPPASEGSSQSSIFGSVSSQSSGSASAHTASIFGNSTSSSSIFNSGQSTVVSKSSSSRVDSSTYSKLEDLSEEDIKWFESDSFEFGCIPVKPPTIEMCK